MTYRTPGVYVEEISVFPPSVAEVETAIPAFIGFTEFAKKGGVDVTEPLQITSLKEYEQYFGGPKTEAATAFNITVNEKQDDTGIATGFELSYKPTGTITPYRLYYAMQMFFANGGGKCYVMSAGGYDNPIDEPKLSAGIAQIRLLDEPTLLVIPEAVSLGASDYLTVCSNALTQAHDLKDRFAILDIKINDPSKRDFDQADITAFRNLSNENTFLRYGAAYYPYLQTTFNYTVTPDDLVITTVLLNGKAPGAPAVPPAAATPQPHITAGATVGSLKATNNVAYNALLER